MSNTQAPPKRRSLATAGAKETPVELKKLAKEFYFSNKEANAASTKASKARKALFAGMKEVGLRMFGFKATKEGSSIELVAEVSEGRPSTKVNIEKLRKIVKNDEKFMGYVSMSKTAVVETFGGSVADQVCETIPNTNESVSVGPKK